MKNWIHTLKLAGKEWAEDKSPRLAAALAYYALFSIAPLLVISITVAGLVFGDSAAQGEVMKIVSELLGEKGAEAIRTMLEGASQKETRGVAGAIGGIIALLFGASGVFLHLKDTLNSIWEVPEQKGGGLVRTAMKKLWSFGMVLAVGFLLLVSLVLSTALAAMGSYFSSALPLGESVWMIINALISVAVITLLFAAMYKWIPDAEIQWSDVWAGAFVTAVLFVLGKFLIGLYLGKSATASSYGAAASLILILMWLYYSGLIVFFGAEFTEVWARRRHGLSTRADRRRLNESD